MIKPLTPSVGLRELSAGECEDLLRRNRFGRLALGTDGWPAILPVNYLYDGTSVVIRTGFRCVHGRQARETTG